MKSFSIIAVRILESCASHIKKVLKNEWYFFSEKYILSNNEISLNKEYYLPTNFFADNININAIVGKNGCGKSALIELMLRILNNTSANLISTKQNNLTIAQGLYASLYFEINGTLWFIKVDGEDVMINKNGEYQNIGMQIDDGSQYNKAIIGYTKGNSEIIPILQQLFFTIISNYSIHSYNTNDFNREWNDPNNIWLNELFHKNDGYLTPIAISPFKNNGILNIARETFLTNNRLASLFYLFKKQNINFIDDYEYQSLEFKLNKNSIIKKYQYYPIIGKKRSKKQRIKEVTLNIDKRNNYNITLKAYFGNENTKKEFQIIYQYIVAKTFEISNKYPNYKNNININIQDFTKYCTVKTEKEIIKLVNKIKRDNSHTSLKIRQALNFLEYANKKNIIIEDTLTQTYIDDQLKNEDSEKEISPEKLIELFPPSCFDVKIKLKKEDKFISFKQMSSGERQFLFFMSSILYHLRNLNSVMDDKESVHYRNINIILEEVELYFHPEYQRKLIDKLIRYITKSKFSNIDFFNIIIITHSPFVLSDIPKCNIMFLENGEQLNKAKIDFNTLGANIHNLLREGFFLENGLVGEHAEKKIKELADICSLKKKEQSNSKMNKNQIEFLLNCIGEPIIKTSIQEIYNTNWNIDKIESIEKKIEKLNKELKRIKNDTDLY